VSEQPSNTEESLKNVHHFFAFIAVLLIMIGQIILYTTPVDENVIFPPSLWISIAGILLFIWSRLNWMPRVLQTFFARFKFSPTVLWITASVVLSSLTVLTMILFEQRGRTNFIPVLMLWLFAGLCYIAAFSKNTPSISQLWEGLKLHKREIILVGLITLLGLALRFYKLGDIPKVVNGDEGRLGLTALSTNLYPFANPFALWENFGALYLQVVNLALYLFGVSPFSLRVAAAIGGTLAIPALYLLARQVSGRRIAVIAACLLAFSHTHIHFSRTVAVAYIQGTWLIPLELYFLISGLMKRSSWRTAVGGALLAVHFSVYLDSQIITALILIYMVLAFLFLRAWFKPVLRQAAVFWGGFAVVLLPELAYILAHPDIFFNRMNANGIVQSGWLAQTMTNTGQSAVEVLVGRVIHAFLSLIYYPSFDFYGSQVPMLSMISAVLFMIGLAVALLQMRSPQMLLLNGYFWAGTLSVGLFAIPPSADTYRMLIVLPAAFLLAAIGLDHGLKSLGVGWPQTRKVYTTITALLLFSLLIFNVWAYYFQFAGRCQYGTDDTPTRFASFLGNYTRTLNKENKTYLLRDDTYFYGSHDSVNFLSNRHIIINVPESADTLQREPDETIIAGPNRIAELRTWADSHPGGELHYEYDCDQTILLAYQFP
jgi:uncharacterized membrane protein